VHWPHPLLFTYRLPKKARQVLANDHWKAVVKARCVSERSKRPSSITHFYAKHESVIREQLALAEISFRANGISGTDNALETLGPALFDNLHRFNWRLYHLYARLVCCGEADAKKAFERVLTEAWARPEAEPKPKELAFLASYDRFVKFHGKTRSEPVQKRLKERVEFAVSLRGGQSSSGQDTAFAERARSNRPRPHTQTRKAKLERRSERRGKRKKVSFWNRIAILWKRASATPESKQQSLEKPRLTTRPKTGHWRFRPFVSPRPETCIPTERKSRSMRYRLS
jgi:hypothetical protein